MAKDCLKFGPSGENSPNLVTLTRIHIKLIAPLTFRYFN